MYLVSINIPIFHFSPFKIFVQLLVPTKFSITIFVPIFNLIFVLFNEIMLTFVKYSRKLLKKIRIFLIKHKLNKLNMNF